MRSHPLLRLARPCNAFYARQQVLSAHKVTHVSLTNDKKGYKYHFAPRKPTVWRNN